MTATKSTPEGSEAGDSPARAGHIQERHLSLGANLVTLEDGWLDGSAHSGLEHYSGRGVHGDTEIELEPWVRRETISDENTITTAAAQVPSPASATCALSPSPPRPPRPPPHSLHTLPPSHRNPLMCLLISPLTSPTPRSAEDSVFGAAPPRFSCPTPGVPPSLPPLMEPLMDSGKTS